MNQQRRLVLNVVSSLVQVVTSTVLLLVLYRYLVGWIGIEGLGVWSLVLAVGSATQIANLGLPGTITKFVAEYSGNNQIERVRVAVQTAVLSIAVVATLLTLLAYPLGKRYLHFAMSANVEAEALRILPIALVAFWLLMYSSTYQSALMGLQRYAESNAVMIADSVLQLALCMVLVPDYGLMGLVIARLICNVFTFLAFISLARRYIPGLPWLPLGWNRSAFREMVGYAGGLQLISLLVIFADPVTKGLLGRFGSLSAVGYYEMADKLIKALRTLLVSANQVMLPKFAMLHADDRDGGEQLFAASQRLNCYFAMPAFAVVILAAPIVSGLWLGQQEPVFILAMQLLGVGWLTNVLALPTYFASLGAGVIRVNVVSHMVLVGSNVMLGWVLGVWLNATGVMLGWAIALALSSIALVLTFGKHHSLSWSLVIPESQRLLGAVSLIGVGVALLASEFGGGGSPVAQYAAVPLWNWLLCIVLALPIGCAVYLNEGRREVVGVLRGVLGRAPGPAPVWPGR